MRQTYLLYEALRLIDVFVYKKCIKEINFFSLVYFKSVFIKPNKLYINSFNNNFISKFTKIAFSEGPK